MTDSTTKHFSINPETNARAMRVWNKWKSEGVNMSDRLCKLMIEFDEEAERAKLRAQNGGLSPNDAFCLSEEEKSDSRFDVLPPMHKPLSRQDHLDKLPIADIVELEPVMMANLGEIHKVVSPVNKYIQKPPYYQTVDFKLVDESRQQEWHEYQVEFGRRNYEEQQRRRREEEEEEQNDKLLERKQKFQEETPTTTTSSSSTADTTTTVSPH